MVSVCIVQTINATFACKLTCCAHFQADVTSDLDETIKSILNRLSNVENENIALKQQNAALNDRLTHESDRLSQENDDLNDRLTQENDDLRQSCESLTDKVEFLTQKLNTLEQENHCETQSKKHVKTPGPAALSLERNMTSSDPEPDTRSQFTAFACTNDMVTLSCPGGRTILTVSANYGQYNSPNSECTDCCAPNPQYDCTEVVAENRPTDWLGIQMLCDNQTFCEFENLGSTISECEQGYLSDYMQLFYDCLPDDETGPVAFTAYANNGSPSYDSGDIILFNEVLTNASGHYSTATSSFICPWHGVYLMSVNSDYILIYLMHNKELIGRFVIDNITDAYNRGSTTIVTECERGDTLWVRSASPGRISTNSNPTTLFTGVMIHRY